MKQSNRGLTLAAVDMIFHMQFTEHTNETLLF